MRFPNPRLIFLVLAAGPWTGLPAGASIPKIRITGPTLEDHQRKTLPERATRDYRAWVEACQRFEREAKKKLPSSEDDQPFATHEAATAVIQFLEKYPVQGAALREQVALERTGEVQPMATLEPIACGSMALLSGVHRLSQYRIQAGLSVEEQSRVSAIALRYADRLPRELHPSSSVVVGSAMLILLSDRFLIPKKEPIVVELKRLRAEASNLARNTLNEIRESKDGAKIRSALLLERVRARELSEKLRRTLEKLRAPKTSSVS